MPHFQLNKDSSEPLYKQLAAFFIEEIKNKGGLEKSLKLPTEREISESFAVSRITVRQALKILEDQDLIEREQGKGTFLKPHKLKESGTKLHTLSRVAENGSHAARAKLVSSSLELASEQEKELLGLADDTYIVVIKRVHYADEVPVCFEISRFTQDFTFLLGKNFAEESIQTFLEREKSLSFAAPQRTIEIVYPGKEITYFMDLEPNRPLILMTGITTDSSGSVSFLTQEYLAAEGHRFEI